METINITTKSGGDKYNTLEPNIKKGRTCVLGVGWVNLPDFRAHNHLISLNEKYLLFKKNTSKNIKVLRLLLPDYTKNRHASK